MMCKKIRSLLLSVTIATSLLQLNAVEQPSPQTWRDRAHNLYKASLEKANHAYGAFFNHRTNAPKDNAVEMLENEGKKVDNSFFLQPEKDRFTYYKLSLFKEEPSKNSINAFKLWLSRKDSGFESDRDKELFYSLYKKLSPREIHDFNIMRRNKSAVIFRARELVLPRK